jgi:flagellar hook protein FlgE
MPDFSIPLSGLDSSSAALSTISNNLANLNTVGYKDQTTLFKDLFYQTVGASGSGDPVQVGAGSAVNEITSNFNSGSLQTTGVSTDVAIGGDGFFVVQKNGVQSFTRAGDFSKATDGTLITADGATVMGYPAVNGVINQKAGLSTINVGNGYTAPPNATTNIQLTTNLNANANVGDVYPSTINVYDSLGQSHVLSVNFTKTAVNAWDYDVTIPGSDVGSTSANVSLGSGSLTFDGNGNLTMPSADVTGLKASGFTDGASALTFGWQLFSGNGSQLTQVASPNSTSATTQDGYSSGTLQSFTIDDEGVIQGAFSNGKSLALGQLALANFPNEQGLVRQGANDYQTSLASGQAVIGAPGTGGRGTISGGSLELSNVDIATEFTELITAQRGFEANARTITTFDQVTQDTIDLKH